MTPPDLAWLVGGLAGVAAILVAAWWLVHFGRSVQIERARELFRLQHERFEEMLLAAAATTGKPRGLIWTHVAFTGDAVLAWDTRNGEPSAASGRKRLFALVPVMVRFEPEPGSEMESVPAAREPRSATALFQYRRGHWSTDGRVVFNLNPAQALAQLAFTPAEELK